MAARWHAILTSVMLGMLRPGLCVAEAAPTEDARAALAEAARFDDVAPHLIETARAQLRGKIAEEAMRWTTEALHEVSGDAGIPPTGEELARWLTERRPAIARALRKRLGDRLPDLLRHVVTQGMFGGRTSDVGEVRALERETAARVERDRGGMLDAIAAQWSDEVVGKVAACFGTRSADDACPLPQAIDPTNLAATIDRVVQPKILVDLIGNPLGEAIGESTVAEIKDRLGTALRGELPPELHDYLMMPIDHFRETAKLVEEYLPGAQWDKWKGKLMGKGLVSLPNAVYGGILTASAIKHFSRVVCGPMCINWYELNRGREVTEFLVWQLRNRQEITISVGQLLSAMQYVGKELHLPDPGEWGRLGRNLQTVRAKLNNLEETLHKVDAWYGKGTKIAAARAEMIVGEFEKHLKALQAELLTPVQRAIAMTEEGFGVVRAKLKEYVSPWDRFIRKVREFFNPPECAPIVNSYRAGGSTACVGSGRTSYTAPAIAAGRSSEEIAACLQDSKTCALCQTGRDQPETPVASGILLDVCDGAENAPQPRDNPKWRAQTCTIDLCQLHRDDRYKDLAGKLSRELVAELAQWMVHGDDRTISYQSIGPGRSMTPEEGQRVVDAAKKWIGYPYIFGGDDGPSQMGVDCSHFVDRLFAKTGYQGPYERAKALYQDANVDVLKLHYAGLLTGIANAEQEIEKLRSLGITAINVSTLTSILPDPKNPLGKPGQLAMLRQHGFPDLNEKRLRQLLEKTVNIALDSGQLLTGFAKARAALAKKGYALLDPIQKGYQAGDVVLFPGHMGFYDPANTGRPLLSAAGAGTPGAYNERSRRKGEKGNDKHDGVKYTSLVGYGEPPIYVRRIVPT
ncbi:MAG: C40 family peptidase, partial [Deltaproteobacteria bacterium]|nr:C40 family peptidase [Deltaproteobacteria bacterium]